MKKSTGITIAVILGLSLVLLLFVVFGSKSQSASAQDAGNGPSDDGDGKARKAMASSAAPGTPDWLELPQGKGDMEGCHIVTHRAHMNGTLQRNYTLCYDQDLYAALWVAYPLCSAHTSKGREETWGYDPQLSRDIQTNVRSGYGVSVPTANYPKNFYARGHQIPNADRSAVPEMQAQTYFSTNMTPQIQHGFNGGIWAKLEEAVRSAVPQEDTLYVVTGAIFSQGDELSAVRTIVNKNDSKTLPVPESYWKALLKVERGSDGVVEARTIGFLLPHEDLKGHSYAEFTVTVDDIEKLTGLDLFAGLPDSIETVSETASDWISFKKYLAE